MISTSSGSILMRFIPPRSREVPAKEGESHREKHGRQNGGGRWLSPALTHLEALMCFPHFICQFAAERKRRSHTVTGRCTNVDICKSEYL